MKTNLILTAAIAALMFVGCKSTENTENTAPELVTDDCGVVQRFNPEEKTVYLVFTGHFSTNDNGYFENFDGIEECLDTLAAFGVKGSFFPTGNCFREPKYENSIKRIINEGHYLSAHSSRHLLLCTEDAQKTTLVSQDSLARDFAEMEQELNRFGLEKEQFCWLIPPYENYNKETAEWMRALGYKLLNPTNGIVTGMDWMAPDHPQYMSAAEQVQNIFDFEKEHTLTGKIILVHAMVYPGREDSDRVYTHLGEIIRRLQALGYGFKCVKDIM